MPVLAVLPNVTGVLAQLVFLPPALANKDDDLHLMAIYVVRVIESLCADPLVATNLTV
jgi:hypothetical protein